MNDRNPLLLQMWYRLRCRKSRLIVKTKMLQLVPSLTSRCAHWINIGLNFRCSSLQYVNRQRLLSILLLLLIVATVISILPAAVAADNENLKPVDFDDAYFQQLVAPCLACHAVEGNSTGDVGPTLRGVLGRRVANIDGYGYSAALYQKAAVGLFWDAATLDEFLQAPQTFAPGNAMQYSGVADKDDRAQLIAWLATGPAAPGYEAQISVALKYAAEVRDILQIDADAEYGEYLAGNCLTCHSSPGATGSVPPIIGLPADYFIDALLAYQQGERTNSIMQSMSETLGVEELAALARFFSQSPR